MAISKKGFKIVHLNIRSIRKHLDEIQISFDGYDVIGLTETWLHKQIENRVVEIDGYKLIRQDRYSLSQPVKTRGGGIAIYIKNRWAPYVRILSDVSTVTPDVEVLWLQIAIPCRKGLDLGIVYRPPDGNVQLAVDLLDNNIQHLEDMARTRELIILGDFNIDYKKTRSTEYKTLKELERKYQLSQYIRGPTRVTHKIQSTIDLIFSNAKYIAATGVLCNEISDHLPVFIIKKKEREVKTFSHIWGRTMKNYDVASFQNLIISHNSWKLFWKQGNNVNELWDIMINIIQEAANMLCPMKKIHIRDNTPAWFSKEVIELINRKKEITRLCLKQDREEDFAKLREQKRLVRNSLRKARQEVIMTSLEENRSNSRKFWRCLNNNFFLGKKSKTQSCSRLCDAEGNIIEGETMANYLSTYYAENGEVLAKAFKDNRDDCPVIESTPENDCNFKFRFIPLSVVSDYVKDIDVCKSSGIEDLSSQLVKDAFKVLTVELTHILNESITTCKFPDAWAVGTITPIPKEGDPLEPGNWRPITILPLPSKLLEKAVHYQIISYLDEHALLQMNQHGFRKHKSTSTAIIELTKVIFDNYNKDLHSSCLFVDYKKAFETLDHNALLQKLNTFGFDHKSIKWVKSYLGNRRHVVRCGKILSTESRVKYGVPQGSILGPLYFIMYVNDLITALSVDGEAEIIMYADDTVLLTSGVTHQCVTEKMQRVTTILTQWCIKNKLTINTNKTKHMLISRTGGNPTQISDYSIDVNGVALNNVSMYKYLGVYLDNTLKFEEAVNETYLKANRKLFTLRRIRSYVSPYVANLIYKQFVLPLLDYVDFIIESAPKRAVDQLGKIQRRAIKIIDRGIHHGNNTVELERLYNLNPLKERRRVHHLSLMYRLAHDGYNLDVVRPSVHLRSKNKIKFLTPATKLTMVLNSPFYRGARLWDMLSEDVQRATTKFKFKKLIQ